MEKWLAAIGVRKGFLVSFSLVGFLSCLAGVLALTVVGGFRDTTSRFWLSLLVASLVSRGLALPLGMLFSRRFMRSVECLAAKAKDLARGVLGPPIETFADDEIAEAGQALNHLDSVLRTIATRTESLVRGTISEPLQDFGEGDELTPPFRRLVGNIRGVETQLQSIGRAAVEGQVVFSDNAGKFDGVFRGMIDTMYTAVQSLHSELAAASTLAARVEGISDGSEHSLQEPGNSDQHKGSFQECLDLMNGLLADTKQRADAINAGTLPSRIAVENYNGNFRIIAERFNAILEGAASPVRAVSAALQQIARGEIPPRVSSSCSGELGSAMDSLNKCIAELEAFHTDVHQWATNPANDSVSGRIESSHHEGLFRQVLETLVKAGEEMTNPLVELTECLGRIANGEIPPKLAGDYPLVYQTLVGALNRWIDAIGSLSRDADALTTAVAEGRFAFRTDPAKHRGEFRKMLERMDQTVDTLLGPLVEGSRVLTDIAEGDFRQRMIGDYAGGSGELKNGINALADRFVGTLKEVAKATSTAATTTDSIEVSAAEVAAGAHEQHAQAQEVAAATEEIARSITEISQNTISASHTAHEAKEAAKEGGRSVTDTIAGLRQVGMSLQNFASSVLSLSESSNQIGEIVRVINDIADQTNLLALNAAIEAARAGEEGRGFSVVADEVRKLADRTTKATKEISLMITKIQGETATAMEEMGHGIDDVDSVITKGERAEATLHGIVEIAEVTSDLLDQIARASEQQATASEQVSRSIEGITSVTAHSAERTERIAEQSRELRAVTSTLEASLAKYRLVGDGGNAGVELAAGSLH